MTANQIAYYKAKQEAKHYKRSDAEQKRHNEAGEALTQYSNLSTEGHYQRQDAINKAHYERSDQASLISASATSSQADTAAKRYALEYEIEHASGKFSPDGENWYVTDDYYANSRGSDWELSNIPTIPLSSQIKISEARKNWYSGEEQKEKAGSYTAQEFANYGKGFSGLTAGGVSLTKIGQAIQELLPTLVTP